MIDHAAFNQKFHNSPKDMQVLEDWAKGTLRFTTGRMTTEADIDKAIKAVVRAVNKLRE